MSTNIARKTFWDNIYYLSQLMDILWIIAGDFNQIGEINEKIGGKTPTFKRCLNFKNHLESCLLNDLGFHGPRYTWSNKRINNYHTLLFFLVINYHTLIKERLDRFLGNDLWLKLYTETKIYHLHSGASDHIPLLLHTYSSRPKQPLFKFKPMWLTNPSFNVLIDNIWVVTKD